MVPYRMAAQDITWHYTRGGNDDTVYDSYRPHVWRNTTI